MNSTLGSVVPLAMFLDFPQNFRLSTWNQYCTQAIAWSTILDGGNTILDGGSTILDGSSTIFCRISQFTLFCRDLHYVAMHFFRNLFLAKIAISATSHVFCMYGFLSCLQTCSEVYSHNMMSKRVWNKYLHNHQSCHHRLSCQVGPPRAVPPSSSQVKTGKQHWSRRRNIPSSSLIISISHYHLLAGLWGCM